MKYTMVDIIDSKKNILTLKNETEILSSYLQKKFMSEISNFIWQSKAKDNLNLSFDFLNSQLDDLKKTIDNSLLALDNIEKIKELQTLNKNLEDENKMLENSLNPSDKIKIVSNNQTIEENMNLINEIENKLRQEWLGYNEL